MPMTKAEKAALEAVTLERDMYKAMVISPTVEPDLKPEKGACGWIVEGYGDGARVEKASTSGVSHRTGPDAWERVNDAYGWYQRAPWMYSRASLALRQLRHEQSRRAAMRLAQIDRSIVNAETNEKEAGNEPA